MTAINPPRAFDSGHELRDNGMNDYDLFCPTVSGTLFVPLVIGLIVTAEVTCPLCLKPLGKDQ